MRATQGAGQLILSIGHIFQFTFLSKDSIGIHQIAAAVVGQQGQQPHGDCS
jgi:hypothetical protein